VWKVTPHFVWDAMSGLGLDTEVLAPASVEPPKAQAPEKAAPPPARLDEPAAPQALTPVVTRSAIRVANPNREFLFDFAPESDEDASTEAVKAGIARGWVLVAAISLVAVLAIAGMFLYVRLEALSEVPRITLPPPPARIVSTIRPIVAPDPASLAPVIVKPRTPAPEPHLTTADAPDAAEQSVTVDQR